MSIGFKSVNWSTLLDEDERHKTYFKWGALKTIISVEDDLFLVRSTLMLAFETEPRKEIVEILSPFYISYNGMLNKWLMYVHFYHDEGKEQKIIVGPCRDCVDQENFDDPPQPLRGYYEHYMKQSFDVIGPLSTVKDFKLMMCKVPTCSDCDSLHTKHEIIAEIP